MTETRGTGKYERVLARCKDVPPITTAIAHPCDDVSVSAAIDAARAGILQPILVGPAERIRRVAKDLKLDVDGTRSRTPRTARRARPVPSSSYARAARRC